VSRGLLLVVPRRRSSHGRAEVLHARHRRGRLGWAGLVEKTTDGFLSGSPCFLNLTRRAAYNGGRHLPGRVDSTSDEERKAGWQVGIVRPRLDTDSLPWEGTSRLG